MTEEAIIKIVLDEAFHVHKKIGPGRWESVYKNLSGITATKARTTFGNGKASACIF
jgi:hypothetical protein